MNNLMKNSDKDNIELLQIIQELTEEIKQKDRQLQEALTEVQQIKQQMIQMEKMSMLGQMVAGLSHEINNPINFIYGNLPYVETHVEDLLKVVETYQSAYPTDAVAVKETLEEVELDFILEDLPRIVESMKVGADRIRELVLSLRNFYRLDEVQMKPSDLIAGIESTLVLLQNRYKKDIEIVRQYSNIPLVECHVNQINQVFMNLLGNAIDALLALDSKEKRSAKKQIVITTQKVGTDLVLISIADNGLGISPEHQKRVFEPFFTTKPMGVGTGLGLSISYEIVKQTHVGEMYCYSTPGEGTTFVVELPVHQSKRCEQIGRTEGVIADGHFAYRE